MTWRKATIVLMAAVFLLAVGWDCFVAFTDKVTISEIFLDWCYSGAWILPYALGVLSAHLSVPNRYWSMPAWGPFLLCGVGSFLWLMGSGKLGFSVDYGALVAVTLLVAGAISGFTLWPQRAKERE